MKESSGFLIRWFTLLGTLYAQVGIGTTSPTEKLDVRGNLRLEGAFMPGNSPGQVGQVLVSQGPNLPPIWQTLHSGFCSGIPTERFLKWSGNQACYGVLAEEANPPYRLYNTDGGNAVPAAKLTIRGVTNAPDGIHAYATGPSARAIYGEAQGAQVVGVFGSTNASDGYGLAGSNSSSSGNAVGVGGVTYSTTGAGVAGLHFSPTGLGTGVIGATNSPEASGGTFVNNAPLGNGEGRGLYARSAQFPGPGALGHSLHPTGLGVVGLGENNNTYFHIINNGAGGAFTASRYGVIGFATAGTDDRYGGAFFAGPPLPPNNTFPYYAYVASVAGGVAYKVVGTGVVSTILWDHTKRHRIAFFAPEAPEILLMDMGEGQLQEGRAYIQLDPDFSANIHVDAQHPLRVFIQLRGECNGVYVTNESAQGFEVRELQGGRSNAPFFWQVFANRRDDYDPQSGALHSKYQEVRKPRFQTPSIRGQVVSAPSFSLSLPSKP